MIRTPSTRESITTTCSAGRSTAFTSRMGRTSGCAIFRSGIPCHRRWCAGFRRRASTCRRKTCSPSPGTRGSIRRCRPRTSPARRATSGISIGVSTGGRTPRAGRSPSESAPLSSGSSLFGEGKTMNTLFRHRLLVGTGFLILLGAVSYSCKDFLQSEPQGTLDEGTLATRAGVEGSLIATYRALDWNNGVGGGWGNSASNWVWGSVTSDDAYKGSEATDQPGVTDIEQYNWTTGSAEDYLNDKWRGMYEGVVRSNATLRLLKKVRAEKPGEVDDATAKSIEGEELL